MRRGRHKRVAPAGPQDAGELISADLSEVMPVRLELATSEAAAEECNELLGRHHYLGYSRPFGRSLRYLISDNRGRRLGCLLFESGTTRLPCRER